MVYTRWTRNTREALQFRLWLIWLSFLQKNRRAVRLPRLVARLLAQRSKSCPRQPWRPHHLRLHQKQDPRGDQAQRRLHNPLSVIRLRWVSLVSRRSMRTLARRNSCYRLVGATMGTPADVVKARIMNQPTDKNGRGTITTHQPGKCVDGHRRK